jgi:NADPH:quinone reductase-like Zn-dependent oxidoreductase
VHRGPGPAEVAAAVADVAGGPLDAVVDVVGGPLLPALLDRIRDGGRWVVAGALGGAVVDLDLRRLYLHNINLVGSSMHTPTHFAELVGDAVAGRVRPQVAAGYALTAIHAAQEEFAGSAYVGKIVLWPTAL